MENKTHVAKCLIYDSKSNILVLQRNDSHPYYPSQIDFPGGAVEPEENLINAVLREINEECSIELSPELLNEVIEKEANNHIFHIFKAELESKPAVKLSWEHQDYVWLSVEDVLSKPIPDNADPCISIVNQYLS